MKPLTKVRITRSMPVALVWIGCLALLFRARRSLAVPTEGMVWAALFMLLAMLAAVGYVVRYRMPRLVRQDFARWIAIAAAPIFTISAAAGGLATPAAILPAGVVLAIAWKRGAREAGAAALVAVVALAGLDLLLGRSLLAAGALLSTAAIAGVGILPLWVSRRTEAEAQRARQRLERVEVFLRDRPPTPRGSSVVPSDLRKSAQDASREADAVEQMAILDRYLRDVRDALGADEVVYWRFHSSSESRASTARLIEGALRATSWSTEDALAPKYFRLDEWGPLVQWSAEGDVVHCDEADVLAHLVAGPVIGDKDILGALSATSARGFVLSREELRERVARSAGHVAKLHALLELRGEHHRLRRRGDALLRAVQQIQSHTTTDSLARGICQTALDITEGTVAALVRWDATTRTGVVETASAGAEALRNQKVSDGSLVADACVGQNRVVMPDARGLPRSGVIYGPGDMAGSVGSLGIVPLVRETRTLGAIVIAGAIPDPHIEADLRNVGLFAAVAGGALEMAWQIDEVSRRASTDQLTGLWNRRYFDDQLQRILGESDRSGLSAALIVADIDHFKRVNDTFGHEAGDAVLKHVAGVFLEQVRAIDICARYGGEEIALLLPQTDLAGATELAERLRRAVAAKTAVYRGRDIPVTSSFGVSSYPQTARTRDALFPTADRALYEAKAAGRNCVKAAPVPRVSSTS